MGTYLAFEEEEFDCGDFLIVDWRELPRQHDEPETDADEDTKFIPDMPNRDEEIKDISSKVGPYIVTR